MNEWISCFTDWISVIEGILINEYLVLMVEYLWINEWIFINEWINK